MTKKNILIISGALFFFAVVFDQINIERMCSTNLCYESMEIYFMLSFILIPILLFSLITYRLHEAVFLAWRDFSTWWIPLTIFLVLITPDSHSVIMSWGKEVPAIGMSALYFLISTIIIFRAYRATKSK